MIPYDELCQALERWASLRRNEAEMESLDADGAAQAVHAGAEYGDEHSGAAAAAEAYGEVQAYDEQELDHLDVVDASDLVSEDSEEVAVDGAVHAHDTDTAHVVEQTEDQYDANAYDETPRSVEVDIDEQAAMADHAANDGEALTQQPTELVPGDDGIGEVPTIIAAEGEDVQGDPSAQGYEVNMQATDEHHDIKREGEA